MVRRLLVLSLAVLFAAFHPLPATELSAEPLVASQITISSQECDPSSPGSIKATVSWVPSGRGEQWLDISLSNNGFAPGTFVGTGPLPPEASSFVWSGLSSGATYYLRVQTRSPFGWEPSGTFAFVTASCTSTGALLLYQVTVSTQECHASSPTSVTTTLSWMPSGRGEQWLDISLFNNRFAPGTFVGIGPLPSTASSFAWSDLLPGTTHFLRVNTLSPYGWEPSRTIAFATQDCGTSTAPVASADFLGLQESLRAQIAASGINAAVAVTDLQTGESINVNGDEPRLPGCTINFFVLLSVVMDLQDGLYSEADVGDLISRTVWSSNPVTARDLLRKTGSGDIGTGLAKINQLLDSLGLSTSTYDHPPAYPQESLHGSVNILTANEMNRALVALYEARIVEPAWRDYLLNKMTGVKPGLQYLIPAGVGNGVVSHKNGFFADYQGWVDNDAGIVVFDRGGRRYAYAISFFTEDVPSKYADIPLGQRVSSLVWQYFSSRYY
jgi:beta-lactamase class A